MKRPTDKDYYSILGVSHDSAPEAIRKAYLARSRILHPDRFDQQSQPKDWEYANAMLAELNEAYSVLRNASSKASYDQMRWSKQQPNTPATPQQSSPPPSQQPRKAEPAPPPPPPPPLIFEADELTQGCVSFYSLPKNTQELLLNRQNNNKAIDQAQVKLRSVLWNYLFIVGLLGWFVFLFNFANEIEWKEEALVLNASVTLVIALLIGKNIDTIRRWTLASLKSFYYVTPLYFIKTEYDIITFSPIWTLKDIAVTHNLKNGYHQNSNIVLKFEGHEEYLTIGSYKLVQLFCDKIDDYKKKVRAAYERRDNKYFTTFDDFYHIQRSKNPPIIHQPLKPRIYIYLLAILVCSVPLGIATIVNREISQKRAEKSLFDEIEREAASSPSPEPSQESNHTASSPEILSESDLETTPDVQYPEQPLPYTGEVATYTSSEQIAPLEIKASLGSHYLLKLVDSYTDKTVLTVFIRSGTTTKIDVPLGSYKIRYASGETWYGDEQLFGPRTICSKADKNFKFEVVGNQVNGFAITLYKVSNGNLHTSPIKRSEF